MIKQFYFKQFYLACHLFAHSLNVKQFDPLIRPYQVLRPRARVGQGAMAMKEYSTSPKSYSITGVSPSDYLMLYPGHSEMQSVYSTASADEAKFIQGGFMYTLILSKIVR